MNSILDIAGSVLLPKALAIDGNPSFVVVDNAKSSNVCVNNPRLIDLVPTKANAEAISPSIKNESWYVLNQLSIGAIPTSYNEGANQIAARLSLCDNTSVTDWQLEAVVPGKSIILGTKNSVTPPISLPSYDVEFTLSNPALIEIKNALGENPNEIELHLFAFDDSTHITKTNVFHRKVQLLVRDNINSIYRYNAERDNIQGGDDWMRPKTLNLIKAMVERYKNLPQLDRFTFNDISNMNGSYFPGHWNHNLGLSIDANLRGYNLPNNAANVPVENIESLKKLFDFFKIYHEDLGKIIFTHTRPIKELVGSTAWLKKHTEIVESEDDPTYFFENETTFNRLRYQCIENRLMRRLVESEPYHGNHYHFEIEEVNAPIRVKQPGTIKVKMSQEKKGVLKFEPEIFTWASDVRHEVFYEKELSDGTFEFVPLQAGVNPLGSEVYGKVKLKFLKIDKSSGDYACSNKFENALPEFASNEDVEYVTVNLVPEGVCKGEFLKPVRGTFGDNGTSNEVGWVSPDAILDKGNIGANSYLCKGSSLKDYSELYGGPDGLLEVTNSQISKGTVVYGNVRIDNSNIDHADILGPASNGPWTPETKYSSIQYADITDVLNEPTGIGYVGPNQIYGMVNMLGSASARVYVDRASLPITAPDSPPGIQGTQILSAAQVINILGGAKISNSFISGRYDSSLEGKELSISGNSEINSSSLVGHLSVSGNSKITSSGLYASDSTAGGPTDPPTPPILGINFINTLSRSLASVTEEKAMEIYDVVVTSSSIGVKGKISGPDTHILNSFIYGNALIGKESTVKDSDVSEIQIERAKIISCLETRNLTISNSLVENSQVQYSSIVDSKIINSSTVLSSTIGTNSEISSSEVNLSKIESSKVLNASRIYESTQILNSTINNSSISGTVLISSGITNSPEIGGGTITESHVDSLKSIANSELLKSTVTQTMVIESVIKNSTLEDSDIRKSQLEDSVFKDSAYSEDSTAVGSEIKDAQLRPLSIIQNSKVVNKSTVTNSLIANGSEIDFSDVDSLSEVDNSKVIGMNGTYRAGIRNSKVRNYSEVNYSYVENSNLNQTRAISSTLVSDTISNSTLVQVSFTSKNITNSYCYQTTDPLGFPAYECIAGSGPTIPGGPTIP